MERKEIIKQRVSNIITVIIMVLAMAASGYLGYKHRDRELKMEEMKQEYERQNPDIDYL